jgi:hypothetical protein
LNGEARPVPSRGGGGRFGWGAAAGQAVQSPQSERAARIHRKRETSQIGLPIAQRQRLLKQQVPHEICMASRIAHIDDMLWLNFFSNVKTDQ